MKSIKLYKIMLKVKLIRKFHFHGPQSIDLTVFP